MVKLLFSECLVHRLTLSRLNSKVSCRNVAVNDLVTDLSDGVRNPPFGCKELKVP